MTNIPAAKPKNGVTLEDYGIILPGQDTGADSIRAAVGRGDTEQGE